MPARVPSEFAPQRTAEPTAEAEKEKEKEKRERKEDAAHFRRKKREKEKRTRLIFGVVTWSPNNEPRPLFFPGRPTMSRVLFSFPLFFPDA